MIASYWRNEYSWNITALNASCLRIKNRIVSGQSIWSIVINERLKLMDLWHRMNLLDSFVLEICRNKCSACDSWNVWCGTYLKFHSYVRHFVLIFFCNFIPPMLNTIFKISYPPQTLHCNILVCRVSLNFSYV